ncbi:hypothetical protein WR25_19196 [Diploscapter pachys]|uniref:Uncharacterized protein n=1 Tax=Diploscapter pachys TaxID=2018661 RepID=A0A2A2KRI4_9BILA|nr:hypothetical protein WR25_19196 [Diploscapter pachys]
MADTENPFRPEDHLYHEVDPIVEQYLHKPFPPSRPGSTQHTPTKQQNSTDSPAYLQNGLSKEQLMHNEKQQEQQQSRGRRSSSKDQANVNEPLLLTDRETQQRVSRGSPEKRAPREEHHYAGDDLPPAGKVELIHVKRKKCGCCSVQ